MWRRLQPLLFISCISKLFIKYFNSGVPVVKMGARRPLVSPCACKSRHRSARCVAAQRNLRNAATLGRRLLSWLPTVQHLQR